MRRIHTVVEILRPRGKLCPRWGSSGERTVSSTSMLLAELIMGTLTTLPSMLPSTLLSMLADLQSLAVRPPPAVRLSMLTVRLSLPLLSLALRLASLALRLLSSRGDPWP